MGKVQVFDHPLIMHKLGIMRNIETGAKEFRELLEEISMLMVYEVTRDLQTGSARVKTPIGMCETRILTEKIAVVPILRAGLGMTEGVMRLLPTAKIGHIGLYRDPDSLMPVEYYCKLPVDCDHRVLLLLDPMLATGGSASAAISAVKKRSCGSIRLVCLIAVPEGIKTINRDHPDVDIYTAALDERLNDHGYIIPGLGDAGDRLFGTK